MSAARPDDGGGARRDAGLAAGLGLLALAPFPVDALAATAALLGPGRRLLAAPARGPARGRPGPDALVALGVVAAYGLAVAGVLDDRTPRFATPALVLALVLAGRALGQAVRRRADADLLALEARARAQARVRRGGGEVVVPAEAVADGETCVVRPGELVPVDGLVTEGGAGFDESLLTGRTLPRYRGVGDALVAGSVHAGSDPVRVRACAAGAASTLARLRDLLARARTAAPPGQARAERVAAGLVPAVVVLAVLVGWFGAGPRAAVAVLVVACPGALALAAPAVARAASGRAARLGILAREVAALRTAARADVLVTGKTGTLTLGEPLVEGLVPLGDGAPSRSLPGGAPLEARAARALAAAAVLEVAGGHPLAAALTGEAGRRGLALPRLDAAGPREAAHGGLEGTLADGTSVAVGAPRQLTALGIDVAPHEAAVEPLRARGWTLAVVALDGEPALAIGIADRVRPTTTRAVRVLERLGVRPVVSTGDHEAAARAIGALAGIDEIHADASPARTAERVRALRREGHVVAVAGEGGRDAAALAAAEVGLAVGSSAELARDGAPLVLVDGDLARCTVALELARAARSIRRQGLALVLAHHAVALPAAATGLLGPTPAAAAMAAVSLAAVANALRLRRFRSRLETAFGEES